ncbi:MAG: hypothetical protein HRU09_18425, partial [Oligoflexales bacterium]|nr:hypothetical protein [Oligoflexales bacterium]
EKIQPKRAKANIWGIGDYISLQRLFKLRQPLGWNPKQDYDPWLLSLDPKAKSARARLLFREAWSLAKSLSTKEGGENNLKSLKEFDKKLITEINKPFKHLEDAELQILRSDLWFSIDRKLSSALLDELTKALKGRNFGEGIARQVFARFSVSSQLPLENARKWRTYLAGWGNLPGRDSDSLDPLSEPWMPQYLRLRSQRAREWKKLKTLNEALKQSIPEQIPDLFKEQWYAVLARGLMSQKAYGAAAVAWHKSSEFSASGKKLRYLELHRMALFFNEHEKGLQL